MLLAFILSGSVIMMFAAIIVAGSENKKALAALKRTDDNSKHIFSIETQLMEQKKTTNELSINLKKLMDIILKDSDDMEKIIKKTEWLEMKVNQPPKPTLPPTINLSLDKPIKIRLLHKQITEKAKQNVTDKLMLDIKNKLIELS